MGTGTSTITTTSMGTITTSIERRRDGVRGRM
jgi:hypothetical protein